jgi:hypothetical protein
MRKGNAARAWNGLAACLSWSVLLGCVVASTAQEAVPSPESNYFIQFPSVEPEKDAGAASKGETPGGGESGAGVMSGQPKQGEGKDKDKKEEKKPFWATHPVYTTLPRTGWFQIAPTGPGYYSFLDVVEHNYRENPPKNPWPPTSPYIDSFFNADFRYLDDPKNTQFDYMDCLKRIHPNDCWLISLGGEFRTRYMNEVDSRLTTTDNDYDLVRTRLYGDVWYCDDLRFYVEYIDAQIFGQDLDPVFIDVDRSDLLNIFTDVKLFDFKNKPAYLRAGRQELLYGSQRLISPLDWANSRRTFEGVKAFWHGEKVDVDLFYTRPVIVSPSHFDYQDSNRDFVGAWTTFRPKKGQAIDLYYLYLNQDRPVSPVVPPGGRGGFNVNTIGTRFAGDKDGRYLWDFETMYQFGQYQNQSISAGAATVGLGYRFKDCKVNPTFWIYNDYASGDDNGGRGETFNQLFPFGHFYMGFLDYVGRQNIDDLNMQFSFNPTKWITVLTQAHFFYLPAPRDALYSASGQVLRIDPTGSSGRHVGNEIDFFVNFHLSMHSDIWVGYSKMFAGEFIRNTGPDVSPELLYLQYSYKW